MGSWSPAGTSEGLPRLGDLPVGVEAVHDRPADVGRGPTPPDASATRLCSSGPHCLARRERRLAREDSTSGSVPPIATCSNSVLKATVFLRSSGWVSASWVSVIPTQSTMTKCVLASASGVTAFSRSESMMRTPRPFICSKSTRLFTARMNITISIGRMSVPVAIMSTVTAMRGSKLLRKDWMRSRGFAAGDLVGDLLAEGVAPPELVADDPDDVLGVAVVLGEDQGLRDLLAAREDLRGEAVTEGADDRCESGPWRRPGGPARSLRR